MEKQLREVFGERVFIDYNERMIYSHDVASLPGPVEALVDKVADAVVLPETTEEVRRLVLLAREFGWRLTPRGAGTSGYGGVLPLKKGIMVAFTRMREIISLNEKDGTITIQPGVVWNQLEEWLVKRGYTLRCYPSSAPSSTVGGWIAEGGSGIGSYYGGFSSDNLVKVKVVDPEGEVREWSGEQLDLVNRAEGITGLIVEVSLMVDLWEPLKLVLASFVNLEEAVAAVQEISAARLPLWHVSMSTANFNRSKIAGFKKALAEQLHTNHNEQSETAVGKEDRHHQTYLVLAAFKESQTEQVAKQLAGIIKDNQGLVLGPDHAQNEWDERFYPMRLKSLGPSLIPSEAIIPVHSLAKVISEAEKSLPGIAIEAILAGSEQATLLCFLTGDERTAAFTLGFAKSLKLLDITEKNGGVPYSAGLYFADRSPQILGGSTWEKIRRFKREKDPNNLFNPGKILAEGENPVMIRAAMAAAKGTEPLINILEKFFSTNPQMRDRLPVPVATAAFSCAQCGYCGEVCTLYEGFDREMASPRGKWYLLKQYIKGKAQLTQKEVDLLLMCTTCKKCDAVCQVNLPVMDLWDQLRSNLVVDKGFSTYPAFEMMGASIESDLNIWAGRRHERDQWIPSDVIIQDKAEIGYWAGCTASFVESEIAENAVRILQAGGLEFTTLGKDEACCGIPMLVAGKPDTFEIVFHNNLEQLSKRGVKELVISCPGCYVAFTHYYPQWAKKLSLPLDLQFTHITEITERLIKENKLQFKKQVTKKLSWHDSCHIGRHAGIYEPPRNALKAIPGVEYLDTEFNREQGRCCGSVLTRIGNPTVSNKLACKRLQEAVEIGVDALVATCPCCEVQLRVGGLKGGIKTPIVDFSAIIVEALGYESKNTEDYMFEMWGVFEKAIEIMTSDGIVRMMSEMLPEVMGAMPGAMKPMLKGMEALPGPIQKAPLKMMERMIPTLMPMLFPGMMPQLMPKVLELMKEAIPNMPPQMEEKLPTMLPKVMAKIMPGMFAEVAPQLAPRMTAYLAKDKLGAK